MKTNDRQLTELMKEVDSSAFVELIAFTDNVFHGNQAAVCVLEQWLDEELMMNITRENNFSETAFTIKKGDK